LWAVAAVTDTASQQITGEGPGGEARRTFVTRLLPVTLLKKGLFLITVLSGGCKKIAVLEGPNAKQEEALPFGLQSVPSLVMQRQSCPGV
jgi:hypothetical protein